MPPPRRATTTRIVAAPARRSAPIVIRERAGQVARRVGSAAASAAREEKHTITAVVAAAVVGYAQRENMLDNLPQIDAIGPVGTLGAVAWAAGRFMRSNVASHVATGLLSIAAYDLARGRES